VTKVQTASRATVLIVEDDEAFAYAASRYLQSLGYKTVIASGSWEAFRALDHNSVNLVISDVRLNPGEPHGVSFGRMVRNRHPSLPVVLMTAHPDIVEQEKPLPGPVLAKPLALELLAQTIHAALGVCSSS
jgi:two-component system, NtrC family, response regulator GlrR